MSGSLRPLPPRSPRMVPSVVSDYQAEIRRYLLGRLAKDRATGPSEGHVERLVLSRWLDWWVFEGKRYRGRRKPLAYEWEAVHRQVRRLRDTHNPRWRSVQSPEGEVDWLATAVQCAGSGNVEYVCRTSQTGLNEDEANVLAGWCGWAARRWGEHTAILGRPTNASQNPPWNPERPDAGEVGRLKRWAFLARRSRWPLLRSIVAESLRAVFEPQIIDQLPLPSDPATLFELVCLVRIMRA